MTPKKKSRLPLIIVALLVLGLGLGGGIFAGRIVQEDIGYNPVNETLGISDYLSSEENYTPLEDIIKLNPVPENNDGGYETTDIYEKVNPSVVSINVYSNQSISPIGSGTGIVMTADGYIITNAHVVDGGTSVNVVFHDGENLRGTIIGADETTDLAVVKVETKGLVAAEFGDSTQLKVGESNEVANYAYYTKCFGDLNTVKESVNNPEKQVKNLMEKNIPMPEIYMACGTEDFLLDKNREFHEFLEDSGVKHCYYESKGIHDGVFWNEYFRKSAEWLFA